MMGWLGKVWLMALAAALLAGCSQEQGTPVERGNTEQVLHLGNGDEPADLDPHITTGMPERRLQLALFEPLVNKDMENLEIVPGVAESWDVSEDGQTYTFHLRDDARWSNGDPVTAEDFVWSWKRALLPALGNQYAYSLHVLENAEAFNRGEIEDFSEVGVEALDEHTLRVQLHSPVPYFLELLEHHSWYPVHRETVLAHGDIDTRGSAWTRPGNFVGNGPFRLSEWDPNRVVVVEKDPGYWDADTVRLQEIHFHPVQQPTAEERLFRAGQLHITQELPTDRIPHYREQAHPALRSFSIYATYYYEFNTDVEPLDDPRVRKALALAIDREKIVEEVLQGGQEPAYHYTPPGGPEGYEPQPQLSHNVERARGLLAEAGFADGEGFPRLTVLYNTMESHQRLAVVLQQMWKNNLNIDIRLRNQDWRVFLDSTRNGDFEIARAGWVADYHDPNTFLDMYVTDGGNNDTNWSNPAYDEAIEAASREQDGNRRAELLGHAETILLDEVPIAPIYFYARNRLVAPSVRNWHNNVMDHIMYKHVYLEPEGERQGER